jgi:hypothetical protein
MFLKMNLLEGSPPVIGEGVHQGGDAMRQDSSGRVRLKGNVLENVAWPLPSSKRWVFNKDRFILTVHDSDVKFSFRLMIRIMNSLLKN